jgi:nitrile hydratase accessory protein
VKQTRLPNPPGEVEGAPIAEPWQAELLATTVELARRGLFTWKEWADCLGEEIRASPQSADEDPSTAYYRQWLSAFERLLCARGFADAAEIGATQEHWRRSYLHTPHGKPVEFRRDHPQRADDDVEGDHHHHRPDRDPAPVAVSPAAAPTPPT